MTKILCMLWTSLLGFWVEKPRKYLGLTTMNCLPRKVLSCILISLLLTACLKSELPLFEETGSSYSVLQSNYAVTDGAKPIGQLVLSEKDGAYTVVSWSDESATALRKPGQMFQIFAAPKIEPPFLRNQGQFDFYWVQAEMENDAFQERLLALKTANGDPIECGLTCTIDSKATLNQVALLVVETNLAPYRAYVPR